MFKNILQTLAGNPYERELERYKEIVEHINALEPAMQARSDDELRGLTAGFREQMAEATAGLADDPEACRAAEREVMDAVLPEAFAAVREAAVRTIGLRHYDVQLIGGMVLHEGKIGEMKTGEGKTLVASLPLYLNALAGRGAHLVTVNDYLARRDGGWMGPIFHVLGMTVGVIGKERFSAVYDPAYVDPGGDLEDERLVHWRPTLRQECYQAAVTYGTASEFGFDYLRDNTTTDPARLVQREHAYVIVDEVDSVLVDGARTPLIISGPAGQASDMYQRFTEVVEQARLRRNTTDLRVEEADGDYELDERTQTVSLTDRGIEKIERRLPEIDVDAGDSLYEPQYYDLVHYLENAIKAKYNFQRDVDYIVQGGRVILVDQTTGRPMPSRRYSEGLHQAIEAKEKVRVRREDVTIATITVQNYFRMYDKLAGMTGTAVTQAEEFDEVYGLDVIAIPTNVEFQAEEGDLATDKEKVGQVMPGMAAYEEDENYPIITYRLPDSANGPDFFKRVDFPDQVYISIDGKFESVTREIQDLVGAGRPILVGTGSVDASEELSRRLTQIGLAHEVLNAKNHQREALIVAQAGRSGAVTISTSMAGRGTDILLGGNPEGLAAKFLADRLFNVETFGEVVAHVVNGDLDAARRQAKSARAMDEALADWVDEAHHDLVRKAEIEDILGAVVADVRADPAYADIPYDTLVKLTQQINLANIDANRLGRARQMAEEAGIPLSLIPDLQYRLDEYRSLSGLLGQAGLIETLTRLLFEKHYNARAALVRAVLADDLDEAKRITRTIPSLPESLIGEIQAIREDCHNDRGAVWGAGGLHVIGTERHEARRIDDQLRGRAARQGDPGSSRFYLSLEDELMLRFGGDRTKRLMERLNIPQDMPISANLLSNAIEQAQARFETYNFEIRKSLVEYDEAVNRQRAIVYDERHQILLGDAGDLDALVRRFMAETLERAIARLRDNYEGWALGEVQNTMSDFSNVETGEVNTRGVIQRTLSLYPRPGGEALEDLLAIEDDDELVEALHDLILDGMDEGHHLRMLYAEIARIVPLWPALPGVDAGGVEGWDAFMGRLGEVFGQYTAPLDEAERVEIWDELREALEAARREYMASAVKGATAETYNRLQNRMGGALRRAYEVPLAELESEEIVDALLVRVDDLLATARLAPDGKTDGDGDRVRAVERRLYAIGEEELAAYARALMLNVIDQEWRQYLTAIDDLRQGVNLEAFGQRDPKVQFKRRAFEMFDALRADVEEGIARQFFGQLPRHRQVIEQREQQEKLLDNLATLGYRVERKVSRDSAGRVQVSQTVHKDLWSNVGRNDPCPCGSGKKFKDCHYREIQQQRSTVDPDEVVRGPSRRRRR